MKTAAAAADADAESACTETDVVDEVAMAAISSRVASRVRADHAIDREDAIDAAADDGDGFGLV